MQVGALLEHLTHVTGAANQQEGDSHHRATEGTENQQEELLRAPRANNLFGSFSVPLCLCGGSCWFVEAVSGETSPWKVKLYCISMGYGLIGGWVP